MTYPKEKANQICVVILALLTALYVIFCLTQAIFKYHSFGIWFKLLIGIEIASVGFAVVFSTFLSIQNLFDQYGPALTPAEDAIRQRNLSARFTFEAINECCMNSIFWVFAFKYWVLASNVQMI